MEPTVKEMLIFIESQKEYLETAKDLYEIYNRNIVKFLKRRIDKDMEGEDSRREAKSRISTVNILPKVVNKLSGVYEVTPQREYTGLQNIDDFFEKVKFQESMQKANNMLNLFRIVAIEAVAKTGIDGNPVQGTVEKIRVYPAHKFLLMDDGTIDNNVVAFIKILGSNDKGAMYEAYTASNYIKFNSNGEYTITPHDFGRIPVSYATRDVETVMPYADSDTFEMVTLLPLLLSDMNYALKYKCFSVMWMIGLSPTSGGLKPNGLMLLKPDSASQQGDRQDIGQITPTVAVSEILEALSAQYSMWLDSRSIKINSLSGGSAANLSGIAKAIDSADVTQDIHKQREMFKNIERDVIFLVGRMLGNDIKGNTTFPETTILPETPREKIDRIVVAKNEDLLSWEEAVKQANPGMPEDQLQEMMVKILADKASKEEKQNGVGRDGSGDQDQGDK
jgi:hypothetical protein